MRSLRKRTRSPKTRSTEEFQVRTTPRRALDPNTGSSAGSGAAGGGGEGNLSANADVELQRERRMSMKETAPVMRPREVHSKRS